MLKRNEFIIVPLIFIGCICAHKGHTQIQREGGGKGTRGRGESTSA